MAVKNSGSALVQLRTLFNEGAIGALSDGQLLEHFAAGRGEPRELAFAALVERHGPFVLRVCRSVLRDAAAAEDAFQATFLALARKAGSLRAHDSLAPWLHQAAYRAAAHDRSAAIRRRSHEHAAAALRPGSVAPPPHANDDDLEKIIHEEIDRLPGRFRVAVVLCDLEGRTHEQAARYLGCAVGTVKSRLARGRKRLRGRLVRRGVAPALALAAASAGGAARAAVPTGLAESTVAYAATANAVPTSVAVITEGVLRSMFLSKIKLVMTAAGVMAALAAGVVALAQSGIGQRKGGTGNLQHADSPSWTYHILVSRNGEPPRNVAVVEMTGDTPIRVDAPGALILIQPKRDGEPDRQTAAERRDVDNRVEVAHEKTGRFPAGAAAKRPMDVMYVNVYSTDKSVTQNFLYNFATSNVLPEIKRTRGIGQANILGNRFFAMRVFLNPDRMRAYNLSSEDIVKALSEQSMIGSPGLGQATGKTSQSKEYVLVYGFQATATGRYNKPEQYANIILKAIPNGDILRLKDVGEVELGPQFFDIYSDIDGHPSAAIVLKQVPGSNAATVIEEVKKKLEQIKENSFAPVNFEVTYDVSAFLEASEDQGMIYAVIQTPPGSTLEHTNAKSHEVQAIAKGIEGVTSVCSLAGYEVLTEGRGSNEGTCLIKLKNRSDRKLTSRQIIELLEEKCRTISNVKLEFFEPAAVPALRGHHP
jgi:RNA polymerase sigma factor (sigma-70 family)